MIPPGLALLIELALCGLAYWLIDRALWATVLLVVLVFIFALLTIPPDPGGPLP